MGYGDRFDRLFPLHIFIERIEILWRFGLFERVNSLISAILCSINKRIESLEADDEYLFWIGFSWSLLTLLDSKLICPEHGIFSGFFNSPVEKIDHPVWSRVVDEIRDAFKDHGIVFTDKKELESLKFNAKLGIDRVLVKLFRRYGSMMKEHFTVRKKNSVARLVSPSIRNEYQYTSLESLVSHLSRLKLKFDFYYLPVEITEKYFCIYVSQILSSVFNSVLEYVIPPPVTEIDSLTKWVRSELGVEPFDTTMKDLNSRFIAPNLFLPPSSFFLDPHQLLCVSFSRLFHCLLFLDFVSSSTSLPCIDGVLSRYFMLTPPQLLKLFLNYSYKKDQKDFFDIMLYSLRSKVNEWRASVHASIRRYSYTRNHESSRLEKSCPQLALSFEEDRRYNSIYGSYEPDLCVQYDSFLYFSEERHFCISSNTIDIKGKGFASGYGSSESSSW